MLRVEKIGRLLTVLCVNSRSGGGCMYAGYKLWFCVNFSYFFVVSEFCLL